MIAADQTANVLGKGVLVQVPRLLDHLEIRLGYPLAEALREGEQEQDHLVLLTGVEATDHAEVHQRQPAVVSEQDVAGVWIAMEHAVDRDLLHVRRQQIGRDGSWVERFQLVAADIGQMPAFQKAEGQHAR